MYTALAILAATAATTLTQILQSNKNIRMQRSNNKLQLMMGILNMMREDNATQRRTADLRAAGLSPTLAAGSPAASNVSVNTQAPESKAGDATAQGIQTMMQAIALRSQTAQTDAQTAYTQQKIKQDAELFPKQMQRVEAQTRNTNMQTAETDYNIRANKRTGTPTKGASYIGGHLRDLFGADNAATNSATDSLRKNYNNMRDAIEQYKKEAPKIIEKRRQVEEKDVEYNRKKREMYQNMLKKR